VEKRIHSDKSGTDCSPAFPLHYTPYHCHRQRGA